MMVIVMQNQKRNKISRNNQMCLQRNIIVVLRRNCSFSMKKMKLVLAMQIMIIILKLKNTLKEGKGKKLDLFELYDPLAF